MQLSDLKKGLLGYRKDSVYQYIASLNESFSQKLQEAEQKADEETARWKNASAELEEELTQFKQESEAYKKIQFSISGSIIDVQNYAERIKQEIQQKERQRYDELEEQFARRRSELEEQMAQRRSELEQQAAQVEGRIAQRQHLLAHYAAQVEALRGQLQALLQSIDGASEQKQQETGTVMPEEPHGQNVLQHEKKSGKESREAAQPVNMALFRLEKEG